MRHTQIYHRVGVSEQTRQSRDYYNNILMQHGHGQKPSQSPELVVGQFMHNGLAAQARPPDIYLDEAMIRGSTVQKGLAAIAQRAGANGKPISMKYTISRRDELWGHVEISYTDGDGQLYKISHCPLTGGFYTQH